MCKRKKLAVEFVKESGEAVVDEQLIANKRPVGNGAVCPLFLQFDDAETKQFENGIVIRKRAARSHITENQNNKARLRLFRDGLSLQFTFDITVEGFSFIAERVNYLAIQVACS